MFGEAFTIGTRHVGSPEIPARGGPRERASDFDAEFAEVQVEADLGGGLTGGLGDFLAHTGWVSRVGERRAFEMLNEVREIDDSFVGHFLGHLAAEAGQVAFACQRRSSLQQ
jgi:hypothetical protein